MIIHLCFMNLITIILVTFLFHFLRNLRNFTIIFNLDTVKINIIFLQIYPKRRHPNNYPVRDTHLRVTLFVTHIKGTVKDQVFS